jgi:hypothetical protein
LNYSTRYSQFATRVRYDFRFRCDLSAR